ncbi:MAG TPA: hypothetical protein VMB74_19540 [Streptosporangiaceae bacterium]|nr:hypothetical protein [Streptosporangiaceae bacterium]
MRIPMYLEIAQWALLLGLGSLLIVLYRQLGRLLSNRNDSAELGPPVGSKAAPIRYAAVPDGSREQFAPGHGQPALIAFVDPTCPACEQLVSSLGEMQAAGELADYRVLLLMSDPPGYVGISAAFQSTSLPIGRPLAVAEVAGYRATGTPLLVAIDGSGTVRAAGVTSKLAEVRSYASTARSHSGTGVSDGVSDEREVVR